MSSRRYVVNTMLYCTDNGRIECGAHCGASAAMTGFDIGGTPIHLVTADFAREWRAQTNTPLACEACGLQYAPELGAVPTSVRGLTYPESLRTIVDNFTDTSWHNDVTDSVSFSVGSQAFTVWVEHVDPRERSTEWGWNPETPAASGNQPPFRFTVMSLEREGEGELPESVASHQIADAQPLLNTDDPEELLVFVGQLATSQRLAKE